MIKGVFAFRVVGASPKICLLRIKNGLHKSIDNIYGVLIIYDKSMGPLVQSANSRLPKNRFDSAIPSVAK